MALLKIFPRDALICTEAGGFLKTSTLAHRREKQSSTRITHSSPLRRRGTTHEQNGQTCGSAKGSQLVHIPSEVGTTVMSTWWR
ncbi:MAG: hypothetical protein RDV41_13960 [Planctomycetota bacterium]|nr:hypothetical protein [Planctomycetota bacterium]